MWKTAGQRSVIDKVSPLLDSLDDGKVNGSTNTANSQTRVNGDIIENISLMPATNSVGVAVQQSAGTTEVINDNGTTATAIRSQSTTYPMGRKATTETINLTGEWQLVVSNDFKTEYGEYLKRLGQPRLVRSVALSIVGMTSEETIQSEQGRKLTIRGHNAVGIWERTLEASTEDDPVIAPVVTCDDETVQSECWWENNGLVHRSWLRNVEKYGGGSFESKRYLQDNGNTLVCESTFHPTDTRRRRAKVTWKFQRVESTNTKTTS